MKSAVQHQGLQPFPHVAAPSILPDLPAWRLSDLAGRLVELSGQQSTAHLTAAFGLVLDAQLCGDRAAWVTFEQSAFFPPRCCGGRRGCRVAAGRAHRQRPCRRASC